MIIIVTDAINVTYYYGIVLSFAFHGLHKTTLYQIVLHNTLNT